MRRAQRFNKNLSQQQKMLPNKIFTNMLLNSKKRNHPPPDFSITQLRKWIWCQSGVKALFDKWKDSGYDKWLKPSCDRLNDELPYTFDNLQLVTWKENYYKGVSKKEKQVTQYDLLGNKIKTFNSISQASRELSIPNSSISNCINGKQKKAGKFIWKNN